MSRRNFRWPEPPNGLYRDTVHGKIAGICEGIGIHYQIKPNLLRFGLIFGCACGFFIPLIAGYVLMIFFLPPMPIGGVGPRFATGPGYPGGGSGGPSWRPTYAGPTYADSGAVRRSFEELDRRLGRMEGWVTSDDYALRQKFKDL
jgi:phage shock protein PspC (stress-responsive transcriptional regulator)